MTGAAVNIGHLPVRLALLATAWLGRTRGRGSRSPLTVATYADALREALARAGKHLVEPATVAPTFKVLFRDARYLYPLTKKFYLHLLTVLRPVGK